MESQRSAGPAIAATKARWDEHPGPDRSLGLQSVRVATAATNPPSRLRLLAAARHTFEQRGYNRTTVAAIARSARVTPATFYRYFASKDDVLQVLVDQVAHDAEETLRRVFRKPAPGPRLLLLVRAYVRLLQQHAALLEVDQQRTRGTLPVSNARTRLRNHFTEMVREEIAAPGGLHARVERIAIHPMTADVLGAMVHQVCQLRLVADGGGDEGDGDPVMAALESVCARALGVGTPQEASVQSSLNTPATSAPKDNACR